MGERRRREKQTEEKQEGKKPVTRIKDNMKDRDTKEHKVKKEHSITIERTEEL